MNHTVIAKIKITLLVIVLSIFSENIIAQSNNGIFFQAIARDNFQILQRIEKYICNLLFYSLP